MGDASALGRDFVVSGVRGFHDAGALQPAVVARETRRWIIRPNQARSARRRTSDPKYLQPVLRKMDGPRRRAVSVFDEPGLRPDNLWGLVPNGLTLRGQAGSGVVLLWDHKRDLGPVQDPAG